MINAIKERERMDMARPSGAFRVEAAGSMTPELEGTFKSISHPRRSGKIRPEKPGFTGRNDYERR